MKSLNFDSMSLESGIELKYWSNARFHDALIKKISPTILANACRLNILSSIKAAGSGHIGTSFSSVEIIMASRFYLNRNSFLETTKETRGTFFSSKGHDAPAIYAIMHMLGELSDKEIFSLRRLHGLPGHPEIDTPGIPTNTGSLGMGISKAKGFVHANRIDGLKRKVIVLLGDGELQEGQIWESLSTASRDQMSEIVVIVDGNKIQSDSWISNVSPNQNLRMILEGNGWNFLECNGHDFDDVLASIESSDSQDKPTLIYASTFKGCGVDFMSEFPNDGLFYKFHSGTLPDDLYELAVSELMYRVEGDILCSTPLEHRFKLATPNSVQIRNELNHWQPKSRPSSMISHWAELLPRLMAEEERIVILDADLAYDTGTFIARASFPERYIQAGIAEQDMVSMAGTIALSGKIPIVHSFASFLTMRPTEQIFNNATERSKIIYMGFLAGLLPSPPGFSHQALTDVGIISSIPNIRIIEPSCSNELRLAMNYALRSSISTYIRISSVGDFFSEVSDGDFGPGELLLRKSGNRFAIICSGPWLTEEAVLAAEMLGGDTCAVFTYPFLNSAATDKTVQTLSCFEKIIVLENFSSALATSYYLSRNFQLASKTFRIGLEGVPKNGWNAEVLEFHGLNAAGIAKEFL
jgi:transketolase